MKRQMTLQLRQTEQLVTVWDRLGEASREELMRRLASLIAAAAQAELGHAAKEGRDEKHEL
jgi:hypothetical protein